MNVTIKPKNIKRYKKERHHVVFIESHQMSIIKKHVGRQRSSLYLFPVGQTLPVTGYRVGLEDDMLLLILR
jgi:hypothetical protein